MIDGFVTAALALASAVKNTGVDDVELRKLQVHLPAEVFDRIERNSANDPRFVQDALAQARETIRIADITFVRRAI
jgi:hypothetical protein